MEFFFFYVSDMTSIKKETLLSHHREIHVLPFFFLYTHYALGGTVPSNL